MNAAMEAPVLEQQRRCRLEEVFGGSFISLLELAPRNPVVRGLILAQTKRMPPVECETFDQVRDWVELNCEKRLRIPVETIPSGRSLVVAVEFSETEYGRASYSVRRSGSEDFHVSEEDLLELVENHIEEGNDLAAVVEAIAAKVRNDAWEICDPNLDDYGDYSYDDHDTGGTQNSEMDFSKSQIREHLINFLREYHPELLEAFE